MGVCSAILGGGVLDGDFAFCVVGHVTMAKLNSTMNLTTSKAIGKLLLGASV